MSIGKATKSSISADRQKLVRLIKDVLSRDDRLLFAYLYGSFVTEKIFRDIDVGVYVKDTRGTPFVITSDLMVALSRASRNQGMNIPADQFDVQVINEAPFTFLMRIFREGMLLLDRDPDVRTDLMESVSRKYRECIGLLREASLL